MIIRELCAAEHALVAAFMLELSVAVAVSHREHGVARSLMSRALLKAKVLGKQGMVLTCLTENIPMRRLARSVGLTATTLTSEVESELSLGLPQIGDVVTMNWSATSATPVHCTFARAASSCSTCRAACITAIDRRGIATLKIADTRQA